MVKMKVQFTLICQKEKDQRIAIILSSSAGDMQLMITKKEVSKNSVSNWILLWIYICHDVYECILYHWEHERDILF